MNPVRRVYIFNFSWLFIIVLPILYPYYASLGMTVTEFFQLQAAFGLSVALVDIPAGYFADLYGRKLSLCIGSIISALGYLVLSYATSFWGLFLHEVLVGIALGFISGCDVALLYDSLPLDKRHHEGASKALSFSQWSYSLGEASGALIGGFLVTFSFRHVIFTQMIISWLPFLSALTLKEPNIARKRAFKWDHIPEVARKLFVDNRLMRLLSMNFVVWFLANFIIIWSLQKYWTHLQIDLKYFGILWAFYTLSIGFAALSAPYLQRRFGLRAVMLTIPIFCFSGYILMTFDQVIVGIMGGLLIYFSRGLNNVTLRDQINMRLSAELRATANSMLSFMFRFTFGILGPFIGSFIDLRGIHDAFVILSMVFVVAFVLITPPLLRMKTDLTTT
ncbi:MAG: MFS transporter [Bdellovibrionales bacterium]|nr:MFS transporter [Bdellovibrionales bacterium]